MKLIEAINNLVSEGEKRKLQIKDAVYNVLYTLGKFELEDNGTTYLISDIEQQNWMLDSIMLNEQGNIQVEVRPNDEQGSWGESFSLEFEAIDEEAILNVVHSILSKMDKEEISSRLYEVSEEQAITDMMKKYNLSEEDLFLKGEIKPEYQEEFSALCHKNFQNLANRIQEE